MYPGWNVRNVLTNRRLFSILYFISYVIIFVTRLISIIGSDLVIIHKDISAEIDLLPIIFLLFSPTHCPNTPGSRTHGFCWVPVVEYQIPVISWGLSLESFTPNHPLPVPIYKKCAILHISAKWTKNIKSRSLHSNNTLIKITSEPTIHDPFGNFVEL